MSDEPRLPVLTGRAWRFADRLRAHDVLPAHAADRAPAEATALLFAGLDPSLAALLAPGDVLVAGQLLGLGPGGELAARALRAAGVVAAVAASFADGFDDALLAAGVPPLEVDAPATFVTGHRLRLDLEAGTIADLSSGDRQPVRNLSDARRARLRTLLGG
ncbi:MAG: 3-isopropylmalate dehydratase small subunit [bacterium]|nr:3-isopropylmalate dehydratase small subunit [bacterium]